MRKGSVCFSLIVGTDSARHAPIVNLASRDDEVYDAAACQFRRVPVNAGTHSARSYSSSDVTSNDRAAVVGSTARPHLWDILRGVSTAGQLFCNHGFFRSPDFET